MFPGLLIQLSEATRMSLRPGAVGLKKTGGWAGEGRRDGLGILTVIVFLFWRGSASPSQESLRFPSLPDSLQAEEAIFR